MSATPPSPAKANANADWLNAFLPLGFKQGDNWNPVGSGVLIVDRPLVWLVTASEALTSLGEQDLTTWVPSEKGAGLLNISDSQRRSGIGWIHHPAGLSATLFPLDPSFQIKAFAETQCTKVRDLQPLQPTASMGCLYGADIAPTPSPSPAVCDGVVSSVNQHSGDIYSTAPLLPRNVGAPLLLASPYGGAVTLAGILLGNAMITEADPRILPVRLSKSICVDAAMELIRSEAANAQRQRVTQPQPETQEGAPSDAENNQDLGAQA